MKTDGGADAVIPALTVSAVIELRRDVEGHLTGWVSDVDGGGHRCSFIGTLDLLRTLIDRLDQATEATTRGHQHDLALPDAGRAIGLTEEG